MNEGRKTDNAEKQYANLENKARRRRERDIIG